MGVFEQKMAKQIRCQPQLSFYMDRKKTASHSDTQRQLMLVWLVEQGSIMADENIWVEYKSQVDRTSPYIDTNNVQYRGSCKLTQRSFE